MIHLHSSADEDAGVYRIRATLDLAPAIAETLRRGTPVIEFRPDGAYRFELDGFGGLRRVLITPWPSN